MSRKRKAAGEKDQAKKIDGELSSQDGAAIPDAPEDKAEACGLETETAKQNEIEAKPNAEAEAAKSATTIDLNSIEIRTANGEKITAAMSIKAAVRFSIIIPSYNNVGFIIPCLKSIYGQTFGLNGVEVIAVNDGSTDGSAEVFEMYGEKFPHFKLLNNGSPVGAGAARNMGLKEATGQYIFYVDCDDSLSPKSLELIDSALRKHNDPDVAIIPFVTLKNNGNTFSKAQWRNISEAAAMAPGPWAKVFKRSLAVPFPVGFRGEDTVWHYVQFDKFNTYCNVEGDEPCYLYNRKNASAITDTLEWSAQNPYTLEFLARDNLAIKAGKNDKFFSDILRAIAAMYDYRNQITKPAVKLAWFARFKSMYQGMVCGHFHN